MSIAGEIIDELVLSPRIKYGGLTAVFGAIAVGMFVIIGVSADVSKSDVAIVAAASLNLTKSAEIITGGLNDQRQ